MIPKDPIKIAHLYADNKIDWQAETARVITWLRETGSLVAYIDLFCGGGGTTEGIEQAHYRKRKLASVIIGINHDDVAIACHKVNHPNTLHLIEDVRIVNLKPIKEMVAAIRAALPYIKLGLWMSAECTHHSNAKGGDSRDADSRSLADVIFKYMRAIKPDIIQVENVVEFRSWGPLKQKVLNIDADVLGGWPEQFLHDEHGMLFSKNGKVWVDITGLAYKTQKKNKKDTHAPVAPWMVPIKERVAEYFNDWMAKMRRLKYLDEDRNINSADVGALTSRNRYYGQMSKRIPIAWPLQTHAKDPAKHLTKTGAEMLKHRAVREALDMDDKGDSIFVPGRIEAMATYIRVLKGGIKFIAGGEEEYRKRRDAYVEGITPLATKGEACDENVGEDSGEGFMVKYNSSVPDKGSYDNSIFEFGEACPAVPTRNMFAKVGVEFLPFITQFNNNCVGTSVDDVCNALTQKEKFALTFMQQRNGGDPNRKVFSVEKPARTVTCTGGNMQVVNAEEFLPFLSNYHGNGHNCHSVDAAAPAACAADCHAVVHPQAFIVSPIGQNKGFSTEGACGTITATRRHWHYLAQGQPFIVRDFSGGGQIASVDEAAGALPTVPKMNIVSPEAWIMNTSYNNVGSDIDDPSNALLTSRHHPYVVHNEAWLFDHQYGNVGSSTEKPSPAIIASQNKKPLHLAQVEFAEGSAVGIVIYKDDKPAVRELKLFMAVMGIVDIKMRMLKETELLPIQGFPRDYFEKVRAMGIKVTVTNAKKYIGNAVEVTTAKKLAEAYGPWLVSEVEKWERRAT